MQRVISLLLLMCLSQAAGAQHADNKKSAKQQEEVKHLKLYPTTADKYVNIYVTYDQPTDVVITLVASENNYEQSWKHKAVTTHQQSVDVTTLVSGSYLIRIEGGGIKEEAIFDVKR